MSGRNAIWLIAFSVVVLMLAACGQHSSRLLSSIINPQPQHQQNGQQPRDNSDNNGPLPGVFELDGRIVVNRAVSADQTVTSQGWEALRDGQTATNGTSDLNIEQVGTGLTLRAFAPGEYAYGVYGQAVGADPKPLKTLIDSAVCSLGGGRDEEVPVCYYVGIADYTFGAWRWFGPFGNVDVEVTVNSEALKSRFKSPSNNYYFAVLASNGSKAASALPSEGSVAGFPIDINVRQTSDDDEDPGGLTIEQICTWVEENLLTEPAIVTGLQVTSDANGVNLSWDTNIDPDVDIYQILRADPDTSDDPVLLQGVLAPTVQYTDTTGIPGKSYRYLVRARNDAGYGGAAEVMETRSLSAPNVQASDGSYEDYVQVQWDAVEGAANGYKLFSATTDTGTPSLISETDSATLSYDDSAPALGEPRWYWVQAVGEDCEGALGGPDQGMRLQLNPVQATATDGDYADHVEITWGEDTSTGLQYYRVYRADDDSGTNQILIADNVPSTDTTYNYTAANGCPWNTSNYYVVTAVIDGFEQPVNYVLGDLGHRDLGSPQSANATQGTEALSVNVNWNAVNNATRYAIYRMTAPGVPDTGDFIGDVAAPLTVYYDSTAAWGATEGVHYSYYIAARWDGPDSEQSLFSTVAGGWRGIGIPLNVTASDGSYLSQILVSWDSVAQATEYKVYRDGSILTTVNAPTTACFDPAVNSGVDYEYAISACIADGEGQLSLPDTGCVNLAPIADLQADVTQGSPPLSVEFDASGSYDPDGEIVKYEWDFDSDGTYDLDTGGDPITTYMYTVRGIHDCTVRVTDDGDGATSEDTIAIDVLHWETITIDDCNMVDEFVTLAIVSGNPAICYIAGSDMKYVRATNASGTVWGTPVTVGGYWMQCPPYMAEVNGYPAIVYGKEFDEDLTYIRATDADGSAWGTPVTLDTKANGSCLVVVNGNPAVSYRDATDYHLKYVRASDVDGTSWNTPVTVESAVNTGTWPSMAIVGGNPAISYYDSTNGDLKYVRASDANGVNWNTALTLDNSGAAEGFSSLAVVNGNPAISYNGDTIPYLKYMRASDANGTTWNTPLLLSIPNYLVHQTSLAVFDGKPAIAFNDSYNMSFIQAADADGNVWNTQEYAGPLGTNASMRIVNGYPAIAYSYWYPTEEDLLYSYYVP